MLKKRNLIENCILTDKEFDLNLMDIVINKFCSNAFEKEEEKFHQPNDF